MNFDEKLNKLNPNQRLAVETIDGPVMVIAGPGTGKTEILSLRIGYILKQTDTAPGSILCLTYTDAASTEMRHRLIEYIGPEAYKIQVSTFHSFCNLVIQENSAIFQQARELEPISEIDKFKLLQKLIDGFDDQHLLKKFKGQTYSDWTRLHDLFMTMKKENWSPDFMYSRIQEYADRMLDDPEYRYQKKYKEYNPGDLKPKYKTEVLDRMEILKTAVGEFNHYNTLMAAEGRYDYEDMLLWVYDAFSRYPDLLADYQERFLYFLVDEFQDTNGIQIAILQKLIDHEWLDQPNVFVVGDDDQAIYRFQGANIENLIKFHTEYQPQVILLEENYRSSQLILNTARTVMQPVENSLIQNIFGQSKKLLASGKNAALPQQVQLHIYPTLTYENAVIFNQLKTWHQNQQEGSLAVLYSKHELGRELSQALKGAGIPYQTQRSLDVLTHLTINHVLDIIQCIDRLSAGPDNDDALLYRVLHLRYLQPRTADLQRLIVAFTSRDRSDRGTLYMWLADADKLNALGLKDRTWMSEMHTLLDECITAYHSLTLMAFIEKVVHRFGIMDWILTQPEKFQHLYALKTFYTFVDKEASGKINFRVSDLLEICDLMRLYKIRLPVQELTAPSPGIHLSSLHGAKGLEFDKVLIKNITENEWEKKRGNHMKFSFPDNLVRRESLATSLESDIDIDDQDKRRLLYVGMTRAKQDLILSYALKRDDGKSLIPSLYLTEIEKSDSDIQLVKPAMDENILADYLVALMSGAQRADLHVDEAEIKDRVKNYILNVSALNLYLECPVRFFYEKILEIPSGQPSYLIFGSGLHEALQHFFRKRFTEKDVSIGKEYLIRGYELFLDRYKHRLTQKEYTDLMVYGKKILGEYFETYHPTWSDQVQYEMEYKIRDVHIGGVPVTGFIDRLDIQKDGIHVYDYKSGKTDKFYIKLKTPGEQDPSGGDYWRQMVFYDLLLRQDSKIKKRMTHGYIQALEPEKDGKFVQKEVIISDEDRDFVTNQVIETYQKIQNMEFQTGCGECAWCQMHNLNPTLINEDEE